MFPRALRFIRKIPVGTLAQVVTVVVAIFGVYRYFDELDARVRSERSAQSLSLIREYRSDRLHDAKMFVFNFWQRAKRTLPILRLSADDRDKLVLTLVNGSEERDKYSETIITVASFFDEVAFCSREDVCDRTIIADYFCPEFDEFMVTSSPILTALHEGGYNAGETATRFFAESCG